MSTWRYGKTAGAMSDIRVIAAVIMTISRSADAHLLNTDAKGLRWFTYNHDTAKYLQSAFKPGRTTWIDEAEAFSRKA
jgi:hypothetical protein